jgi:Flp pilus assembly protein TadD
VLKSPPVAILRPVVNVPEVCLSDFELPEVTDVVAVPCVPEDPEELVAFAMALIQEGAFDVAARHLESALGRNPTLISAWYAIGQLRWRQGSLTQSEDAFRTCCMLAPGYREAAICLAQVLRQNGKVKHAVEILRRVDSLGEDSVELLRELSQAERAAGFRDEALSTLQRASEIAPSDGRLHHAMGVLLRESGDLSRSIEHFRRAVWGGLNASETHLELAETLLRSERLEDSIVSFSTACMLAPNDTRPVKRLAETLAELAHTGDILTESQKIPSGVWQAKHPTNVGSCLSGELGAFPLPDLLEFLRLAGKTGLLVVVSDMGIVGLRLVRGALLAGSTSTGTRLQDRLRAAGVVGQEVLRSITDESDRMGSSAPFVVRLLDAGVEPSSIRPLLVAQLLSVLEEVLGWSSGFFAFRLGDPDARLDALPNALLINPAELMLELFRRDDETRATSENRVPVSSHGHACQLF